MMAKPARPWTQLQIAARYRALIIAWLIVILVSLALATIFCGALWRLWVLR